MPIKSRERESRGKLLKLEEELEKHVMVNVGEGSDLQETVNKALLRFSLELFRLVCEDLSRQLNESREKTLTL